MPQYEHHKIARAEELARHAYRRALDRALREAAKGGGWRTIEGVMYRDHLGWLVEVWREVTVFWRQTEVSLRVKPLGCDPIFWDILEMPENGRRSLSFRITGAWTCPPVELARTIVDEGDMDAAATARRIVEWGDSRIERMRGDLTVDGFLGALRASSPPAERGRLVSTLVTTLLMAGRDIEAEQACIDAIGADQSGGFFHSAGTFPVVALKRIRTGRTARSIN